MKSNLLLQKLHLHNVKAKTKQLNLVFTIIAYSITFTLRSVEEILV